MNDNPPEQSNPDRHVLPPLHTALLNMGQVEQLLADIKACTRVLEILPKHGAQAMVRQPEPVSLDDAERMLANRAVRGLQVRYMYDGAEWWDTLMVAGDGYRVVRIKHDFSGME